MALCGVVTVQGALVNKWKTVRAEAVIEERLDAAANRPPSLQILEQRKRKRLDEWKTSLSAD